MVTKDFGNWSFYVINHHSLFPKPSLLPLELPMSARRVFAGSHGASHLRAELGAARTQFAALCAAFGADAMLSAKIWLVFAASGAGVVLAGCPPPSAPPNYPEKCWAPT